MHRVIGVLLVLSLLGSALLTGSCAQRRSPGPYEAGTVGAGLGALAGALIDEENRWRGAVIGGLIGGVFAATVTEISRRSALEAAHEGKPVVYQSQDGFQRVESTPIAYNAETNCHKVRTRVWQDGKLVKDEVKEVCESQKSEPVY